jgi:glutamate synthase (NADPH/NADH) large chain
MILTEGVYAYRKYGEHHAWNPESVGLLQWSTRNNDYQKYKEYTALVDCETSKPGFLRGLLEYKTEPHPSVEEVEPAESDPETLS